ncbi:NACHT domain-containing protein [Saccharothrix sp. 6-C]|uniref:NACHT domain-containing protein n=1 Tax=Saccharothrix sp. 6-C TaxID=2781735 RepID=UPI0019175CE5|nr:NACHT domain-containing protein [Saccharothrix sp. 6-C]QQQ78781.1 NACHT domain-containing protein [Saccharothrix sp. 6-C]
MAERHNEITGGHFTGPVVQTGSIDHLTVRFEAAQSGEAPPLTSWSDRPALTPALRDLLEAQRRATESLPYKLLGVKQPELTQVYVQQTMRPQVLDRSPEPERKPSAESTERTLTIAGALDRNGHLMITGEPGSGKSTVGYLYVQQISEFWLSGSDGPPPLTEPVLPLRVPARALAQHKAWADLLAAGTEDALGRLLGERPPAALLARRALGARWLVFIDGLDEIIEPDTRAQVIDAIAHQVRRGSDHRLVITTRPLPGDELKPLEQAGVDSYAIQPFGRVELEEFARAWFRAQTPITAMSSAEAFVRQVRDGRLRELVRNPLLATIAAIAKTLEPDRPLPNNRVDLYGRFMEYLLDDGASRRNTIAELRRSVRDDPDRQALVEWMHQHRTGIVEHLATHRLDTESPLFEAACTWVRENHPALPDEWQDDLRALLAGTGVFVHADDDLRFRHHSFAEFLAARRRAGEIPADFPDLDEWIERGLSGNNRVFALFTFVLWGRDERDLGRVLSVLLAGAKPEVLLAGRLLAEGVAVDETLTAAVVDRVVELILANGVLPDPWGDVEEAGEVLVSLPPEAVPPAVMTRLGALRDRAELAEAVRVESAVVLGKLEDPDSAARWLEDFADQASPAGIKRGVVALKDLVPEGADRAERLLVRLAAEPDYAQVVAIVSIMLDTGTTEAAGPLVRRLVRRLRADPAVTGDRALPLPSVGSAAADLSGAGPAGWGALAKLAARAKCRDEALWAADRAFAVSTPTVDEFRDAVGAVLSAADSDGVPIVLTAAAAKPVKYLTAAAQALQEALQHDAAVEVARRVLSERHVDPYEFYKAVQVYVHCNAVPELLRVVEGQPRLSVHHLTQVASALSDTKDAEAARRFARSALADLTADRWDFERAVRALFDPDDPATAADITDAARSRSPEHRAVAIEVLSGGEHGEHVGELIRGLLDTVTEPDLLADVAADLVGNRRFELADGLLTAAMERLLDCDGYQKHKIIKALVDSGRKEEAAASAERAAAATMRSGYWFDYIIRDWMRAAGIDCADEIVAKALALPASRRVMVADVLASEGLLHPAVTLWSHVVRDHGEAVDQGVLAASRLVQCGHRDEVLAVLDRALDERRTDPARARLRALRAWAVG